MFANELSTTQFIAIAIVPTLFGIVVHEVAHGWMANRLGDPTAAMLGRLTLNPIKHIDPVGTILVPLILIFTVGFAFGWAKPVPIDWRNLRHPRRDSAWVAAAGPGANFLMAIGWGMIGKLATLLPAGGENIALPLVYMSMFGMFINILLMVFNLIPLPPTDGGRIATSLLPPPLGRALSRVEPFGIAILLVLLLTGVLWRVITPFISAILQLIQRLLGG
ncbi:site-2 protease family protein [Thiohalophilus thiocyanatoxydans]|uniref:Zn-dependent protease n=1 Tax=Thiohalophilus thiocyanatoxydans TaxID=381308 RepID=A0A4R8IXM0_9GAMM|nr:site-2 protease family protein [Thiohalophilus thiocyanatoxydans]TDY02539.1 Zn-dependent protease [Thiohalophilus thiocyanatoxydans]